MNNTEVGEVFLQDQVKLSITGLPLTRIITIKQFPDFSLTIQRPQTNFKTLTTKDISFCNKARDEAKESATFADNFWNNLIPLPTRKLACKPRSQTKIKFSDFSLTLAQDLGVPCLDVKFPEFSVTLKQPCINYNEAGTKTRCISEQENNVSYCSQTLYT